MSTIINFLEAIIVTYGLYGLCTIRNKKHIFIILNITLTFVVTQSFDYIDANYMPLTVIDALIWFSVLCIFTRRDILYNMFSVVMIDLICGISATVPIIFIYHYNPILAGLIAKGIQSILTFGFIKFRKRYAYLENKYWFMIMAIVFFGDCISGFQDELIVKNTYTMNNILTDIFIFSIMGISLYFFHLIEESNLEKERITKEYEKKKYQNLTYNFMKSTKDELDRLEHKMIYQMLLVRNQIDKKDYKKAYQIINQYIDDIHKVNHTVYTGNSLLDALLTLKIKDLKYEVVPCFTISKNEFFDNAQFVNLVLDLLEALSGRVVNFFLKEENGFCVIQFVGKNMKIDSDNIKDILIKFSDLVCRYKLSQQNEINILTLQIGMTTL